MSPGDRRSPGDEEPEESTANHESPPTTDEETNDYHGNDHPETERAGASAQAAPDSEGGRGGSAETVPPRQTESSESLWTQFRTAEDGPLLLFREVLLSFGIVLLLGLLLFGISGVWPPMVAVESESMEPNINQYDLIVVTEPERFASEQADQRGVVTAQSVDNGNHESFNRPGSVIVYKEPGSFGPPIIHRAHFHVEAGENWYDRANPDYISAESCAELNHCPATHSGYITKGDNEVSNGEYDQANGIAPVVRPGWVTGVAKLRLPYVGYIRLALTGAASFGPLLPAGLGAVGASSAYAIGRREAL